MTVFKGYFLIIRRNIWTIMMYIMIFVVISCMIEISFRDSAVTGGFTSARVKVAVMDREGGVLGDTLRCLMQEEQDLVELPDEKQRLQEELFYGNVDYVLIVPENASEALEQGEKAIQSVTVPNSVSSFYVESQVDSLLNQIRVCLAAGFPLEEACAKSLEIAEISADVKLMDVNGNAGIREGYNYYFGYMPYAFLGAAVMSMSVVIMEFKKKDIRRRIQSSAVPFYRQNIAMILSFGAVGILIWGICVLMQAVLYQGGIFRSPHVGYYILNSLVFMAASLSIAYLTGMIANSPGALNGLNNIISLGLCFLGGIFVPIEMLGNDVERVSRFLPTYWYSRINGILGDYGSISAELQKTIRLGVAVQLLFAAACFAVTLALRRMQMREKD
ncbi:MAG: ABC transporter permease [Lachnospiraceae bacterium]|nr:ABC transporter permease [Lachnospiraceae bacterium]